MDRLNWDEVREYVRKNIADFHQRRIQVLESVRLESLLRMTPYMLRAKRTTAARLMEGLLDDFLFSLEAEYLEDLFEGLVILVVSKACEERSSMPAAVDRESLRDGINYIVSVRPDIVELASSVVEEDEAFYNQKSWLVNRLTKQFIDDFCDSTGAIAWVKLVEFNSGNYDLNKFFSQDA
jgi:hypothetical protein